MGTDWVAGMTLTSARLAASTMSAQRSYVPTVGGDGGAAYSTQSGWYFQVGTIVFVNIYLIITGAGSGAVNVTIDMPTDVDRSAQQIIPFSGEGLRGSASDVTGTIQFFTSGSGAAADRLRGSSDTGTNIDTNLTGADLAAGAIIRAQGFYLSA